MLLLVIASHMARLFAKTTLIGFIAEAAALFAAQMTAVATGLASGTAEAAGAPLFFVMFFIVLYNAAILAECITAVMLCVKLFRPV